MSDEPQQHDEGRPSPETADAGPPPGPSARPGGPVPDRPARDGSRPERPGAPSAPERTPADGAPAGGTPEHAPGDDAPDGTPGESPADSPAPAGGRPAGGRPAGGRPAGGRPAGGRPAGGGPAETASDGTGDRPAAPTGPGAPDGPRNGTPAASTAEGPSAADGPAATKAKRPKRTKRTGWRRALPTWRMALGGVLIVLLAVAGALVTGYLMVGIPPANAAATAQSNVYLYADGSQLARDGEVNRENVKLAQVPARVRHTVLAAEDRDFYGESAVDPQAMVRAAWNTATGKGKQSGSTITQQYVKNYYLRQEQTVTRKAKEFFIAIKLDREKSKDEILEGYLNTSYFGRNSYGIQAAAQAYYGIDADELTTAQGAYLAALLNSPNAYDVIAHPENRPQALARWTYVMDGMVTKGWMTQEARRKAVFPAPKDATGQSGLSGQRGYVVRAVKDFLSEQGIVDEDALDAGGYRITTTLQRTRQNAFVKAVDDQVMSQLDKKGRKADRNVRAGGASIDPATGRVVAMYGGIDYTKQYVNNATRRDYQVGSTFKPIVLASALQNGSVTQGGQRILPGTVYDGSNTRPVQGWSGGPYAPQNEDQVDYGQIPVTTATDKSVNAVYAQMAVDVGPDKVKSTAIGLGLPKATPDLQPYPSIALGPATASVLDMAEVYATLAHHGERATYTLVSRITRDGRPIRLPEARTRRALDREAADTTTQVLRGVVDGGTGTAAQQAGRPAAGKTGTAENDTAAWFAGYTPELATVVAVMGQDPVSGTHTPLYGALGQARMNGGGYPAQIWAQFTRDALKGKPVRDFDLKPMAGATTPPSASADPSASQPDDGATDGTGGADDQGTTRGGTGGTPGQDAGATAGGDQGQSQGGTGGTADQGQVGGPAAGGQTEGGQTGDGGGAATGGAADGGATGGTGPGGAGGAGGPGPGPAFRPSGTGRTPAA